MCGMNNQEIVYIVGSKGVGKSSLLKQLHATVIKETEEEDRTAYFQSPNVYDMPMEEYRRIYERFKAHLPFALFIDNIHEIPEDKQAAHILKRILKDTKTCPNWSVMVATSTHGLFSLFGDKRLVSSADLKEVYCVNPEESVGKALFKQIMGFKTEDELTLEHTNMLTEIGHVPGTIIQYAKHLQTGISGERFKSIGITKILEVLDEEALAIPDKHKSVRIKSLAMISACKDIAFYDLRWAPETFSWTCLKSTENINLMEVTVVSPLVLEAVVQYTEGNPNHILDVVDTMNAISAGRPGNVTGRYWEMLVFSKLKECVKIEYSFKDKSGSPAANYLNLSEYLSKKDTRKSLENIISDNHRGMIVHCPNAEAFDFLIFDNCNSIHAIQVTTQTAEKKCSGSDFFKNENIHFKYLLTPFEVDVDTMIKSKSKLQQAYMTYGLRIVSGASFLTRKELSTFQFEQTP